MTAPNSPVAERPRRAAPQPSAPPASYELYESDDQLITGEAVALDLHPASFVVRATGAMIDFLGSVLLVVAIIFLVSGTPIGGAIDPALQRALAIALLVTVTIVVPTLIETLSNGRSLGKAIMGARVVRNDGGAIGFRHAFIRALTGFLEIFSTFGGLAALVALLNSKSKRLGDLLAGTYSQNERIAVITETRFEVPPSLLQWSQTADVARLPDRLSRRIAQFLGQAGGLLPEARARVGSELAAEASSYVSSLPVAHPEEFLVAVTALRRERETTALRLEKARMLTLDAVLNGRPHGFPNRG